MEEMQEPVPQKKGLRTEFLVAMTAIVISIATLAVYIYQAGIMKSQQHTSVWPYIEWTIGFSTIDGIFLTVKNKGVGPAIITDAVLKLDGQIIGSRELMNKLTKGKADSIWSFTETVNHRVLSPGEEVKLFHMKDSSLAHIDYGDIYSRLEYKIYYKSIYGDCWVSRGLDVAEGVCGDGSSKAESPN